MLLGGTMEIEDHHWITLHRVRFAKPRAAADLVFEKPESVDVLRFCPNFDVSENGLPTWQSDIWECLAVHPSRAGADAMMEALDTVFPLSADAVEAWNALAVPFAHRGEVNWRGDVESNGAIQTGLPDDGTLPW